MCFLTTRFESCRGSYSALTRNTRLIVLSLVVVAAAAETDTNKLVAVASATKRDRGGVNVSVSMSSHDLPVFRACFAASGGRVVFAHLILPMTAGYPPELEVAARNGQVLPPQPGFGQGDSDRAQGQETRLQ